MRLKLLSTLVVCLSPLFAAGSVQQQLQALGTTGNYALTFYWTGDASTGSVPLTAASLGSIAQGLRVLQVETVPGSPAPTSNYSVQLIDGLGGDIMNGAVVNLSSTVAQFFSATSGTPPLIGTFSLQLTGQSVAGAKGKVVVFIGPTTLVNSSVGAQGPQGPAGPSGPTGPPGGGASIDAYAWTQTPGGTLTGGISASVTLTPCPKGVSGSDTGHYVYISGGTGTAEADLIVGGSCTSGAQTGNIVFTPANNHSGAWTIATATSGLQEAINDSSYVFIPAGQWPLYAPASIAKAIYVYGVSKDKSVLLLESATQDGIDATVPDSTAGPVVLRHFGISSLGVQTGGTMISITGGGAAMNSYSTVQDVRLEGDFTGLNMTNACYWSVTGSYFHAPATSGTHLIAQNPFNPDCGDNLAQNNWFIGSHGIGISHPSGGGFRVIANKFLSMDYAIKSTLASGDAVFQDVYANNMIDSPFTCGICITASFANNLVTDIGIVGNYFGANDPTNGWINLNGTGSGSFTRFTITGNTEIAGAATHPSNTFTALGGLQFGGNQVTNGGAGVAAITASSTTSGFVAGNTFNTNANDGWGSLNNAAIYFSNNKGIDDVFGSAPAGAALTPGINPNYAIQGNNTITSYVPPTAAARQGYFLSNGTNAFTAGNNIGNSCTTTAGKLYNYIYNGTTFYLTGPGC